MAGTVFVAGGAGYVGSHCCKAFAKAGWRVVVFDNLSRGWRDFVKWGPLIEGDLLDQPRLNAALAETHPDVVVNFAALAYVGESVEQPALYYRHNVVGMLNLMDAARAAGCQSIVFSSTCATYGQPEVNPITETTRQSPINPYGRSKLMVEQMLADYSAAYGLRSVALRYFNAAGADPDGEVGERHEPETHLIPLAIRASAPGDYSLTVFGDDFDTRDGTCVRDYVHVTDLAAAHVSAADYLVGGGATVHLNLGSGVGATVLEVIAAVEAARGRPVRRTIGPRRAGDPAALTAAPDLAEQVLGWRPIRSDIGRVVADACAWHAVDNANGKSAA